ncbi:HEPN domain-containing protein [candidate division KSB1 bacterium]|nr:HEPN domain-containing protein [candidate division KSB1 bacterium]
MSEYRMKKAKDDLETSEIMFSNNKFSQSVNRSYYAMFHAVRSLLALSKFDSQKHTMRVIKMH